MKTIMKHKWIYYILQWTWGILPNLLAVVIILFNKVFKKKKLKKHHLAYYMVLGENPWGGMEMGMFFFCDHYETLRTKNHELGHSFQNIIWGPLMIFVIMIPSAIRYHYRNLTKRPITTSYDAIWFEGQATNWGYKYDDLVKETSDD